ncbi:sensor histidine kinase [Paenibacillus radicis (ex Gao et al. 2016)]|uniref:Sensor histidine kinase YesM n=1 Tax=Paenibacillus radicis (ex Gao et al. 2016) TaxID=1737354 RepID=A0A917H220_9BACL|nr:sensor histidine kinase [Paenibacillus radicis (ex Gao et al. 2016)]GGG65089.1 sensor histidine kinase YesM [Paenibacillus radicis (ex Gao et al. 2016)]
MSIFKQASLRKKIIILMMVLYIPLPLLGQFWYEKSYKAIKENAVGSSYQLVNQVNDHLDTYFKEVQRWTYPLLVNELTSTFLNEELTESFERFQISEQVEKKLFNPIMTNREDIHGISLVTSKGIAVSSSSYMSAERRYSLYNSRIKENGKFTIMGLEKEEGGPTFLAMAFKFNGLNGNTDSSGMLIVDLKLTEVINITQNVRIGKTGFIWIADPEQKTAYHPNGYGAERLIPEAYQEAMGEQRRGTFTMPTKEGNKLVVFFRSSSTGLTLFSEVLLSELNESLLKVSRLSTILFLVLFFIVMLIASAVMYSLSNSLLTMLRLMKRAELGELSVRAPENKGAEVGSLYRGFNKMVEELKRLVEIVHVSELREKELEVKQKEALLHAMQAQINPHFLYNTLEFINSSAIVEGNDKISRMIVSLGDMFRYNVQNPNDIVSLWDEKQHIEAYLAIQSERFESLNYTIDIQHRYGRRTLAVRSMLQPIVENSFKHGFQKHKIPPNYIRISEMDVAAGSLISIEDGGKGMDEAILQAYNDLFDLPLDKLMNHEPPQDGKMSIGLINVHTRIRMLFGEPYGLFISTSGEDGTCIDILLPLESEQHQNGSKGADSDDLQNSSR